MTKYKDKVEQIISDQSKDLDYISLEVCKGIQDGVWLGMKSGAKKGFKKGLKECMFKGPSNITQGDIIDSLDSIKDSVIENGVKEASKYIFDIVAEEYVESICPQIAKELEKARVTPSTDSTEFIEGLVMEYQKGSMANMMRNLPTNPLYDPVLKGINAAIEDSLKKSIDDCRKRISTSNQSSESAGA